MHRSEPWFFFAKFVDPVNQPMKKCFFLGMMLFMSILAFTHTRKSTPPPPPKFASTIFEGLKWCNIGPFRGGRANAVSGLPGNDQVFFAGFTGGGLWKTVDAGISWHNISDGFFKTGSVGAIAVSEANPNVLSVAFSRSVPGSYFPNAGTAIEGPDGELIKETQPIFQVGLDFITHYDLELVAGRSYSRDYPSDYSSAMVINDATAGQYGYNNPAEIVGKKLAQWGKEGQVIGVVKDFNYISVHRTVESLTLPFGLMQAET